MLIWSRGTGGTLMNKQELVAKFERIRHYYGSEVSTSELRSHIEKQFTERERDAEFKKTLSKYINDIYKLKQWNKQSQKNQPR